MGYQDYLDNMPVEVKDQMVRKLSYHLHKIKNPVIDDQTIMFWNLQLQFMEMEAFTLERLLYDVVEVGDTTPKCYLTKLYYRYTDLDIAEISTYIALKLSGLA